MDKIIPTLYFLFLFIYTHTHTHTHIHTHTHSYKHVHTHHIHNHSNTYLVFFPDSAQLPVPTGLSYTVTDNGLEVTWNYVAFESCTFSFNVIFVSVASGISGMLETNTTSALLEGLRSDEEYNISVSSVVGSSCASSPAAIITMKTGQGM